MKMSKKGNLQGTLVIIFLSLMAVTLTGGFCRAQGIPPLPDPYQEGVSLFSTNEYEQAFGKFKTAWVLAVTIEPNRGKAMMALKGMAQCTSIIGAVDSCIHYYQKAEVLAQELNRDYETYEILYGLKLAYLQKADMEQAFKMTQKLDSLAAFSSDVRVKLGLFEKLFNEAIMQHNLDLAEYYLLEREPLLDLLPEKDRISQEILVYGNLRDFYSGIQNYDKARKYNRRYIETSKKAFGRQPMMYMSYGSEALICACQKNKGAAFLALDSMKNGLLRNPLSSTAVIVQYYEIEGRIYGMFEEWSMACKSFKKALSVAEGTPVRYRPAYFRNLFQLGCVLYYEKNYDEARDCFKQYLDYCQNLYGDHSLAYADALWTMANFEGLSGEVNIGKEYYIQSVGITKQIVAEQLRYVSVQEREAFWQSISTKMWNMAAYALKSGEHQGAFAKECFEALLFSKALLLESDRSMAEAINTSCIPSEQRVYYDMIMFQNQLKGLMNDYEKNKDRIDTLHRKISAQNQLLTPIISKLGYTSFLSLNYKNIKASLSEDEVLLDYTDFISDEKVHQHVVFLVDNAQQHPKLIKSFSEESVRNLMGEDPIDHLYDKRHAEHFYRLMWKPIEQEVMHKKTIYYVPSGMLHQIALENIPLNDGTLLSEHYRFVRLSSAREILKHKKGLMTSNGPTAILYGALKYDMDTISMTNEALRYQTEVLYADNRGLSVRGNGKFHELKNAKEEINRIVQTLKANNISVTPRTGIKGTEESFVAMSGKAPQILHIATHGFFYTPSEANDVEYLKGYNDAMQLSGIILSGGNLAWSGKRIPKGVLGGVLTANKIANLDLRRTDLLVLSACQTGLGKATPEGLYGLQRAFKKAGVGTMIVTLWNLNDKVAKDFMIKFYEELVDSHNQWDKRRAFENAKAYIRTKEDYKDHPYYWAGFVMLD